jgi:tryptophan 7-halogenase
MLDLSHAKRILIVGGGTAGWFAALEMRYAFPASVEIVLVESEQIGIVGAGEGSIPNFDLALKRYQIDRREFMVETNSTYKLGVCFESWQQGEGEQYYHFFSTFRGDSSLMDWYEDGFYPLSSSLMLNGCALDAYPDARRLVDAESSQEDFDAYLSTNPKEPFAYHFDARKLAIYLRKLAELRGVRRVEGLISKVICDDRGQISGVDLGEKTINADFFIDASGFAKLLMGKTLDIGWESFSDYLILDSALPFMMPHTGKHPPLTTLSKAMRNGWMWSIPTQGRLGCGYVYSSAHTTEAQVLEELKQYWKQDVTPINRLKFTPGRLRKCLHANVLAVGLASGFVEPLEATSIAQTLYQLTFFGNLMRENHRLLPNQVVDLFNQEVVKGWDGILDFLVMHYDTQRRDTPFWRDVAKAPRPKRYTELKEVFQLRTPRIADLAPYQMGGVMIFGVSSWEMVGSALGVVPANATKLQLNQLDMSKMTIATEKFSI